MRSLPVLIAGFLLLSALLPASTAQSALRIRSVGEIHVDASGKALGSNLEAWIQESSGVLRSVTDLGLGVDLFDRVEIEGFSQVEKLRGVGSPTLILRGTNAVVSLHDSAPTTLTIQATSDARVRFDLSAHLKPRGVSPTRIDLESGTGRVGSFVLVSSGSLRVSGSSVEGNLSAGALLVFRGRAPYDSSDVAQFVSEALAQGALSYELVTEYSGNTLLRSELRPSPGEEISFLSPQGGVLEGRVRAAQSSSSLLSFDLAYETLGVPASSTSVYVDGRIVPQVSSPQEVLRSWARQEAAFFLKGEGGRTLGLVSLPPFSFGTEHAVVLAANAKGSVGAQSVQEARAALQAERESSPSGSLTIHSNGKITGEFTTAIVDSANASLHALTALDAKTEIFSYVRLEGASATSVEKSDVSRLLLRTPSADMTLSDDAHATLLVDARAPSTLSLAPSAGIEPLPLSKTHIQIRSSWGVGGDLVVARLDGTSPSNSQITLNPDGTLQARLEAGARLVFLASLAGGENPTDRALAEAVGQGSIGAQILAGVEGNEIRTNLLSFYDIVEAHLLGAQKGRIDLEYHSGSPSAVNFVLEARGSVLAAQSDEDISVRVDGKEALRVGSLSEVLSESDFPKFTVDASLPGIPRIIVHVGSSASTLARVTIESRLDEEARARGRADAFGQFKVFYDGKAVGNFVSLRVDRSLGVLSDVALLSPGVRVFSTVVAGSSPFVSVGADGSALLPLENEEARIEMTDTTSGYFRIVAKKATTSTLTLASGIEGEIRGDSVVELSSWTGGYLGSLVLSNADGRPAPSSALRIEEGRVEARLEEGAQLIFRTHVGIEKELSGVERSLINSAIASGKVAGHVLVRTQAALSGSSSLSLRPSSSVSSPVEESRRSDEGVVTMATSTSFYDTVRVVTAATPHRVDVTVSSAVSEGKTLLISLDPSTLSGMRTGDAEILVDGRAVAQARSYSDVLDPTGKDEPVYFILAGEMGTQVLVALPHFSTHTVTLKEREPTPPPVFMYATLLLGAVVAVETVLLVRRRVNP